MKDESKFKEYMLVLGEIFDKEITPALTGVYWKTLEHFSDEQCKRAFEQVIQTAKFFPKPAEFIEILEGRAENKAVHAWIEVNEAVRRFGPYQSVKFSDPVIHSVVQTMGGWPKLMDCTMDEWKWRQKEFERLYAVITERDGKHPDHLPGIHELENAEYKGQVIRIGFEKERLRLAK